MKERKNRDLSKSSEWYDAALVDDKPSRLSGLVFFFLCLIPVFASLAYGAVETWAIGFLAILTGILAMLWMADSFFKGQFRYNSNLLQIPLAGLICIGLFQLLPLRDAGVSKDLLSTQVSSAITFSTTATKFAIIQLCIYLVFFAAALTYIDSQKRLRKIVVLIIVFASIMAFFGIIQKLTNTGSIYWLRPAANAMPFASYVNQHHFAAFMEMTSGLTLSLVLGNSTEKDKKFLLIIALVLMGLAILLTGSRGGLLSYIGVMSFLGLINAVSKSRRQAEVPESGNPLHPRARFGMIGGGIALVLILFGGVLFLGAESEFLRGIGLSQQADVTTGRSHFWAVTLHMIRDNLFFGVGLDAYGFAFPSYDSWNGTFRVEQAHNDYLQIFADAGILGFACLVVFIFFFFKKGLASFNRTSDRFRKGVILGAIAGCFGIFIHSFFDFPLRTSANAFFFLILAAVATGNLNYPKLYKK